MRKWVWRFEADEEGYRWSLDHPEDIAYCATVYGGFEANGKPRFEAHLVWPDRKYLPTVHATLAKAKAALETAIAPPKPSAAGRCS
jgi:hypothetical protein